jgi:hypothetical protein
MSTNTIIVLIYHRHKSINKNRTMDNVQKQNNFIKNPTSKALFTLFRSPRQAADIPLLYK